MMIKLITIDIKVDTCNETFILIFKSVKNYSILLSLFIKDHEFEIYIHHFFSFVGGIHTLYRYHDAQ